MARRLSILAAAILLLFVVVAGQSVNLQFFRAKALDASPINPRNSTATNTAPRGEIVASDGTILAESVPTGKGQDVYRRIYPLGALTSGLVGFVSPTYGTWALEAEYNSYLTSHAQPPQSFEQLLAPTSAADNVTLTINVGLERVAQRALAGRDGAAVVLDPKNGDVLAMYSNPTYNPVPLTSSNYKVAEAAWVKDTANNAEGFPALGEVATQQTFPPGSTFKVITTAAVVAHKPSLLTTVYPVKGCVPLPTTTHELCNDDDVPCGGVIAQMLPISCDPGYALVGLDLGAPDLVSEADSFGYNTPLPIDLPGVAESYIPGARQFKFNLPGLAYSAIGQEDVRTTALQNAMVAAAIANKGELMTPHLLSAVIGPDGGIVQQYQPHVWRRVLSSNQTAQIVPLMQNVVREGTAYGVFPPQDDVAAKTGTAQTGNAYNNTDDWMIAFAPATDPVIAVAVVVPYQATSKTGAEVAGPIMNCMIEAGIALANHQATANTATTCPS